MSKQSDFTVDYLAEAASWVAKLSEQRAILKNLPSFFLYSLLHGIIKTFVKCFARFSFMLHNHTFSGQLEDVNLLFK